LIVSGDVLGIFNMDMGLIIVFKPRFSKLLVDDQQ